ncbi:TetR family transcriptional regulator [Paractinoplanes deccanensis]|uniref:TetR family transcriptional regulator n=1 Tax=Paractinoplanes deccanensis TaxID=113561 RepID=A0ABQ3YCH8_9ACTN|nr:helix-turn-helix domain-containing protein [Actinoplanes deccanensis]GID77717.1 TetR family transcriptional regulator [Actinoplanes deccanensis]
MGRPKGFDEEAAIAAAVELFARRSYDGTSVDDLVGQTGVHRGSLYKSFGSKRGLYLAALRHYVDGELAGEAPDLRFLLLAAAERAAVDDEVAAEVARGIRLLDRAAGSEEATTVALGSKIRALAGVERGNG